MNSLYFSTFLFYLNLGNPGSLHKFTPLCINNACLRKRQITIAVMAVFSFFVMFFCQLTQGIHAVFAWFFFAWWKIRFGPVNLFWSTRYDKAMTLFLACIKEFADFAHAKDRAANLPQELCFQLPYKYVLLRFPKLAMCDFSWFLSLHENYWAAMK